MIETENSGALDKEDFAPQPQKKSQPRWWELLLTWLLPFLVFLLFLPNILTKLNPVTGDEPFYLMTTISLLKDRDLNEDNNYRERDYYDFSPTCAEMSNPNFGNVGDPPIYNVPGVLAPGLRQDCEFVGFEPQLYNALGYLPPHFSQGIIREGNYTKHGVGLSFLIAPAYALANRLGVVIFIMALAGLVALNVWLLAFEVTQQRLIAWGAWFLMTFTAPFICYAFLLFPATPAALFTLYAWRRLRLNAQARRAETYQPANNPLQALLIGLCIGLLPWLHSLYLLISASLFLYWWLGGRKNEFSTSWREKNRRFSLLLPNYSSPVGYALFLVPLILLGALFLAYYIYYYGAPLPNTQDHAGFAPLNEIPLGLLGLLFDQKYGLLIYAPFYLLALVGIALLWRKTGWPVVTAERRGDLIWLFLVATPYVLVIADYKQWWGEWCPPARYLMPVLPLLAVPLAVALQELNGRLARIFSAVAATWSLIISLIFMYNPHLMYNWQNIKPAVTLEWLAGNIGFLENSNLAQWFPSYVTNLQINNKEVNWLAAVCWLAGAGVLGVWLYFSRHPSLELKPAEE